MGLLSFLTGQASEKKLKEALSNRPFLVDVRSKGEFRGGSVRGAVNIPLDRVAAEIKKFQGKENIIVFCRSGSRSNAAKGILKRNGIANVLNGGSWNRVQQVRGR